MRGITRSEMTIAGRNVVTFSSASSPSAADSARKPQLLTSCSSPTRAARIVLDDEHALGSGWGGLGWSLNVLGCQAQRVHVLVDLHHVIFTF